MESWGVEAGSCAINEEGEQGGGDAIAYNGKGEMSILIHATLSNCNVVKKKQSIV